MSNEMEAFSSEEGHAKEFAIRTQSLKVSTVSENFLAASCLKKSSI
jgi:hypothetical protein